MSGKFNRRTILGWLGLGTAAAVVAPVVATVAAQRAPYVAPKATSFDDWTAVQSPDGTWIKVTNGKRLLASVDGSTWVEQPMHAAVTPDGKAFCAVGEEGEFVPGDLARDHAAEFEKSHKVHQVSTRIKSVHIGGRSFDVKDEPSARQIAGAEDRQNGFYGEALVLKPKIATVTGRIEGKEALGEMIKHFQRSGMIADETTE